MRLGAVDTNMPAADRRQALLAGSLLLVMMTGHAMLETARDTLFLARLPVTQLPWTYAAIAIAALLASELNGRLRAVMGHRLILRLTLFIGALGALLFERVFRAGGAWAPHAFYIWLAVVATLATAQFWLLVSEFFNVLQAKRLNALISAGGLLGVMLGGALARVTAARLGDLALLGAGGGLLFAAGLIPAFTETLSTNRIASATPYVRPSETGNSNNVRDLRSERYLQRLLALTLLSTVATTLIDYIFKLEVAHSVSTRQLGSFFGTFNMLVGGVAFLVQIALAPRLLRSAGVGRALMLLPAALIVAALGVVIVPGFPSVLLLRGSDATLRSSLHRSSLELLYLPLSSRARARWKMVVDVLGQRGGQALAGLAILGCVAAGLVLWQMAVIVLLLVLGWAALSSTMERRYVSLFRAKVKSGAIETRAAVPTLDLRSLESLVTSLGSENDDEVLATIELLVEYERTRVIPSLLLYHPSRAVVLRTLEVMSNGSSRDFVGPARRLLERDDEEVRGAAMLALAGQMEPDELRRELNKELPIAARAAVLVALSARKLDSDGSCAREIGAGCGPDANPATRLAFARGFRLQGGATYPEYLARLLLRADHELEIETARVMLASPSERNLPALLRALGNRGAREIVRQAFVGIGDAALAALARAFEDVTLPPQARTHFPYSIARFGSAAAADILLARLGREQDGWVRFKIIRALGQLREHMRHPARRQQVLGLAHENLRQALHFMSLQLESQRDQAREPRLATAGGQLLSEVLCDKATHATDRAVRLVALMHSADVSHNIRQALAGVDQRLRADSIELLVHGAPLDIAQALSAMLERPDKLHLVRAADALHWHESAASYEQRLSAMFADDSEAVRAIAAYHAAELGLDAPASAIVPAATASSSFLARELLTRAGELRGAVQSPSELRRVP